jgi:hypothetical protein
MAATHIHNNQEKQPMKLKLDTTGVSFVCTRSPEQRIAFDTGQPKVDRETGKPLWQVQLMALDVTGADVIAVTVPGDPNITVGQPAQVEGLIALPWAQDGRNGVAFRADALRAAGAPLAGVTTPAKLTPPPAGSPGGAAKPAA